MTGRPKALRRTEETILRHQQSPLEAHRRPPGWRHVRPSGHNDGQFRCEGCIEWRRSESRRIGAAWHSDVKVALNGDSVRANVLVQPGNSDVKVVLNGDAVKADVLVQPSNSDAKVVLNGDAVEADVLVQPGNSDVKAGLNGVAMHSARTNPVCPKHSSQREPGRPKALRRAEETILRHQQSSLGSAPAPARVAACLTVRAQ